MRTVLIRCLAGIIWLIVGGLQIYRQELFSGILFVMLGLVFLGFAYSGFKKDHHF